MANTLTDLIPTLYSALNVVARELIGFIPHVSSDSTAAQAGLNQTVRSPVAVVSALETITPGDNPADSGDTTPTYVDVTLTNAKAYPIRWSGEEQLLVTPNGVVNILLRDQFTLGFRTLANAVEADIGGLYVNASRAYGTAGTTPFATADDHTHFAESNRILDDNGAPQVGRKMVIGSAARAKLEGKHSELFKVNEAGDAGALLRQRQMRNLHNFDMGFSAGVQDHTKGTGTAYDANGGEPVGETDIVLDGGTEGATGIVAGDMVTFAGDTNKYGVKTGLATATGTLVLQNPGLRAALADTVEMTIGGSYTANMFFHQSALLLATRSPAMPTGGDAADDVIHVTDPVSGLTFQVALYRQYRRIKYEIGLVWGVAAPNPLFAGVLLG